MEHTVANAANVVDRIEALHESCPRVVRAFRSEGPRNPHEFDPNRYLEVLPRLRLVVGYVLDYFYVDINDIGFRPHVYARHIDVEPFQDFHSAHEHTQTNPLHQSLITDDSPEGWFELTALRRLEGQFYLNWHALYNDLKILTTESEIEQILSKRDEISEADKQKARLLDTQVRVAYEEKQVSVTYCTFSAWRGFRRVRETYQRQSPHTLIGEGEVLIEIPYDCGVRF